MSFGERHPARFRTTRWSVVQAAGGEDSAAAREALSLLCETYWYPVYAFVRRSGYNADSAEDLTQGFFARLLEKEDIGAAEPSRGRFRSFLQGAVRHFLANERDRAQARKRGGGQILLSIDFQDADRRYALEPADATTPEKLFLRHWALSVLQRAMKRLATEYSAQGKRVLFERLRPVLLGESDESRQDLAQQLEMNENAINVAVHRMRQRFRRQLKKEVAQTLTDPEDVEDELRSLEQFLTD